MVRRRGGGFPPAKHEQVGRGNVAHDQLLKHMGYDPLAKKPEGGETKRWRAVRITVTRLPSTSTSSGHFDCGGEARRCWSWFWACELGLSVTEIGVVARRTARRALVKNPLAPGVSPDLSPKLLMSHISGGGIGSGKAD